MDDSGGGSDSGESARFDALLRRAAHLPRLELPRGGRVRVGSVLCGGRFEVRRRLGEGGMGVVYEAFDRTRAAAVALKTVSRLDGPEIYRLKNEFRSLVEVTHPNLVQLHELFADDGRWLFSMELVDGVAFDAYTRPRGVLDVARLRGALAQLVAGVRVIHAAGKLHRDLKPGNTLVTEQGRLVILDFGLVADPEPGGTGQSADGDLDAGTPAYMAPEQAAGRGTTTASDWYAVGVMLFETLTGALPFEGTAAEITRDKQRSSAPPPARLVADVPEDLEALCTALLARDPARRPDGEHIAALLAVHGAPPPAQAVATSPRAADRGLLGRDGELAALRAAYARSVAGQAVVVRLAGESGVGKSAVVGAFLDELRVEGHAIVAAGRCYERETVPYKAFDGLADDLARHLRALPPREAVALMPPGFAALARVFPVFELLDCAAEVPLSPAVDDHELRRLAFDALAELLSRLRDSRPLVVHVDDLQWADRDSLRLFEHLFASPPPALFVLSHRGASLAEEATLDRLARATHGRSELEALELVVAPLAFEAAAALAQELLPEDGMRAERAAAVAREAGGNPFFVGELCRYLTAAGAHGERASVSLEHALDRRVVHVGQEAGGVLRMLAVAGHPVTPRVLGAACEIAGGLHAALDVLRAAQLVRVGGDGAYECYHDRIRVALHDGIEPELRRALHLRLAEGTLAAGDPDPDRLFELYLAAGERDRAAEHAVAAAERAAGSLAFDRAAVLYRHALELLPESAVVALGLRRRLAEALSRAGRWTDAAAAFAQAAVRGSNDALFDEHQAALHFLASGRYAEGLPRLSRSFRLLGLPWPRTRVGAVVGALARLLRLWLRGARRLIERAHAPRVAAERDRSEALAVEVSLSGAGLVPPYDLARGLHHVATFAMRGLDRGDRSEAALALAMLGCLMAAWGPTRRFGQHLTRGAVDLARTAERPDLAAAALGFAGFAHMLQWRLSEALALGSEGSARLSGLRRRYVYHAWGARSVECFALTLLGHVGQAARLYAQTEHEANELGDELAVVGGSSTVRYLVEDDLERARRLIERKEAFLSRTREGGVLRALIVTERITLALYQGRGESVRELVPRMSPGGLTPFDPAMLVASCAVQTMETAGVRPELARDVTRAVRRLDRIGVGATRALAEQFRATLAFLEGDRRGAEAGLARSAELFDAAQMRLHAELMRYRACVLGGDGAGEQRALARVRELGVQNPRAWARLLAPGFDGASG